MKYLLIIVILAAAFGYYQNQQKHQSQEFSGPITNPVYAESRVSMPLPGGGNIELAMFGETYSQADCKTQMEQGQWNIVDKQKCPNCTLIRAECHDTLDPRYLKLFKNQPGPLTYVSAPRDGPEDREARIVFYGITADVSDRVCEMLLKSYKGNARCIHHAPE